MRGPAQGGLEIPNQAVPLKVSCCVYLVPLLQLMKDIIGIRQELKASWNGQESGKQHGAFVAQV